MMDELKKLGCRISFIERHFSLCTDEDKDEDLGGSRIVKRQNTAPDGQVLPDWLTWRAYETMIGDEVVQTGEILQLPLTYYGPSIPLGPDWAYGGLTSPDPANTPSLTEVPVPISSSDASAPAVTPPPPPPPPPPPSTISSSQVPDDTPSAQPSQPNSQNTLTLETAPGPASPLGPVITSSSISQTSIASPSVIMPSSVNGADASSLMSSSDQASSSNIVDTPSSATPTPTAQRKDEHLVPLLPAILVPIIVAFVLILLVLCCFRRRQRSQQGYTTALGASSGGYGGWLTSSFAKRANGSGERFTSAWTQVPTDSGGPANEVGNGVAKKESSPVSPVSAAEWAKSDERSALLGFIPNHHRASSSVDFGNRPGGVTEVKDEKSGQKGIDVKEERMEELANQNHSLLQRLSLGLGWLSVASLASSRSRVSGSGSGSRIASGFTLEKGHGGNGALGQPDRDRGDVGTNHSSEKTDETPATGTGTGSGSNGNTGSGSGAGPTTTSGSVAGLTEDQLFFRPPVDSASSHHSMSSSPRRGFFSRFITASGGSSKSKRSSGPSRRSWVSSHIVMEGEEDEPLRSTSKELTPEGISVAVPTTPSTLGDGELPRAATRWASRERMRFPVPPSGTGTSTGEKESLISSNNTEYHSADSHYSAPSGPPTKDVHDLPPAVLSTRQPFDKNHTDYAEPALSPFGSRESFTPAKVNQTRSMRDLFSASPATVGRPSLDSGGGSSGNRRSYPGHPIIDDTLLQAISTGRGADRGTYAGLGGVDEFGQTIRAVSGEAPTVINQARWSRSQQSHSASFHSGPSTGSSSHSGPTRSEQQEMLAENDEVSIKSHALRGRRSQPQLILPPRMARLAPNAEDSSDSDQGPLTWKTRFR